VVVTRQLFYGEGSNGSSQELHIRYIALVSRWREIRACNGNVCGESKSQNSHESLLDRMFLIVATNPKSSIY